MWINAPFPASNIYPADFSIRRMNWKSINARKLRRTRTVFIRYNRNKSYVKWRNGGSLVLLVRWLTRRSQKMTVIFLYFFHAYATFAAVERNWPKRSLSHFCLLSSSSVRRWQPYHGLACRHGPCRMASDGPARGTLPNAYNPYDQNLTQINV